MIIEIKEFKEPFDTTEIFEKVIKNFKEEAEKLNLKYRLQELSDNCLKIIKPIFKGIGDSLGKNEIFYCLEEDYFFFYDGLQEDLLNEIKPILKAIPQKFKVEVIKD